MARVENKRTGVKGASVPNLEVIVASEEVSGGMPVQREDSISPVGEIEAEEAICDFPIKLNNPGGIFFKAYGEAAEDFMRRLTGCKNTDIHGLSIVKMITPSMDVPPLHITPYCGFPVVKGDTFSLMLNNGVLIF